MKNNEKIMKYQIPKNGKLLEKVKQLSVEQLLKIVVCPNYRNEMKGYMIHIVHYLLILAIHTFMKNMMQ